MNISLLSFTRKLKISFLPNQYYFSTKNEYNNSKPLISKLTNRSILILHGPDTFKLLQGLTTNDINLLKNQMKEKTNSIQKKSNIIFLQANYLEIFDRIALYTLFLSPKGKIITDAFIYRPKVFFEGSLQLHQDQLWIDIDSSMKKQLFFHLQKYMWKKNVALVDLDNQNDQNKPTIYAGYNHISTISSYLDQGREIQFAKQPYRDQQYSNLMFYDPRGGNYGRRIICMQQQMGLPMSQFQIADQKKYQQYLTLLGFTPSIISTKKLPFQFNFDLLNAISFKKGCYLGQQIVSRSYFTGIVRKRVFPFALKQEQKLSNQQISLLSDGTKLIDYQGKQIGKIIYYQKNQGGLALINYLQYFNQNKDQINQMKQISFKQPFQGSVYCPFQQALQKYLAQTKSKQKNLQQLDI